MVREAARGKRLLRRMPWVRARLRRGLRRAARALARQDLAAEDWALLAVALSVALAVARGR